MIVLACSGISIAYGLETILSDVSFNLQKSEKAALVGVNGAGKSTLFKIICGMIKPDSGDVFIAKNHKLGYLDQGTGPNSGKTVWEDLISAYSHLIVLEEKIKQIEKKISTESNQELLVPLMNEYDRLAEKFSRDGGYEYVSRTKGVLRGLGFSDDQFSLKSDTLSGGQKTRLALARLLLEEPDILMLDEPTNHLDINALEWLEDFLKTYKKSVLIISHDRYFLDTTTTKTIELENRHCKTYPGNYSAFARQKAVEREILQKHHDLQQKEIARMEAFIEQQRRWNREKNIIAAESRQKAIDRIERIDAPDRLPDKIKINLKSNLNSGNDILSVEELSMEYPGKPLFDSISFSMKKNEHVFLMGPNGCGKSTLLKILLGKIPQTAGTYRYGYNIDIGYYDQELQDLDDGNTILEEVWDKNENFTHTQIRNALAQFLFEGEDVFKPINILSGGEKSRVSLVKLMLSGANFMILDEPTNHLDINSREILEEALCGFDGTILAVSHDRYFIRKLSTRVIEMLGRDLEDYKGDYDYYLERRKLKQTTGAAVDSEGSEAPVLTVSKQERLDSKEEKARLRKLEKTLAETEKQIEITEASLKNIELEMSDESTASDHVKLSQLISEQESQKNKLDSLYETWHTCTEALEL